MQTVKIEITYANGELEKLGIKNGDRFEAERQGRPYYNAPEPCWFAVPDPDNDNKARDCVAFLHKEKENEAVYFATCKIVD